MTMLIESGKGTPRNPPRILPWSERKSEIDQAVLISRPAGFLARPRPLFAGRQAAAAATF